MKRSIAILFVCLVIVLQSCSKEFASPKNSNIGVFDELLQFLEENYALFEVKQIDWELIKAHYRPQVSNLISQDSLFFICHNLIGELKDGQASLTSELYTSIPYSLGNYDYEFKREVTFSYIKQKLRFFNIGTWAEAINDTTAYVLHDFLYADDGNNWQNLANYLSHGSRKKIILDLRYAGGGTPEAAFSLVSHFILRTTNVGSMVHKSGKGPQDFKKVPVAIPSIWPYLGHKKIVILTSEHTFNVETYFAAIMQTLPNVTIIGETTGPGGGIKQPYELPNGWIVDVSSNYFLPANGQHTEDGIRPDIEISNTALDLQNKRDRMLERAIAY